MRHEMNQFLTGTGNVITTLGFLGANPLEKKLNESMRFETVSIDCQ
jgi:hypothetical protein